MSADFGAALLRLKEQIGLHLDKEVADLLALSDNAFHARKRRNAFPEDKLFALIAKRPELKIDVAYVLTGVHQPRHARMQADHVAAWAGQQGTELAAQAAKDLIEATAVRTAGRAADYMALVDLASHCDDERFTLLVEVAKAFRQASVQAVKG